jgi:hypothetical protein
MMFSWQRITLRISSVAGFVHIWERCVTTSTECCILSTQQFAKLEADLRLLLA